LTPAPFLFVQSQHEHCCPFPFSALQRTVSTRGWILSRERSDRAGAMQLHFWCAADDGAFEIIVDERAVCFIARDTPVQNAPERRQLDLTTPDGKPVDALYFDSWQRYSNFVRSARALGITLYESDVRPADRYLMERFLTGPVQVSGPCTERDGIRRYYNPRLKPADHGASLRVLSLDIETDYRSDQLLSIAGVLYRDGQVLSEQVMLVSEAPVVTAEGLVCDCVPDERRLLQAFLRWLGELDPDVLVGWNVIGFDLRVLAERCARHRLPFAAGRGGSTALVLPARDSGPVTVQIPGRVVIDGIEALRASFHQFESFALDHVAGELLGRHKLIGAQENKAEEILRQYREAPAALAAYNLEDCRLVREIFLHADLLAFCFERARLTGLAPGRHGGSVAAFDFLYLPRLHRAGYVAPDAEPQRQGGLASPGGYVMESQPGLYKNVLVLDFKSLYPSIIRTFLIDPKNLWAVKNDPTLPAVDGFEGARFARRAPILPELIETLWQTRDEAKQAKNAAMSQAVKIIMNSFYGVLGASACRFYNPALTCSITLRGHEIIQQTRDLIENDGHKVIYGDTDSVFVWLHDIDDAAAARREGERLAQTLNHWWQRQLRQSRQLQSHLEIEFETLFTRFLMPTMRGSATGSKKRYAGLTDDRKLVIKGLESVRTDWTPLAREFQRELLERVFYERPYHDYIRETVAAMLAGKEDARLRYRKRIRQPLSSYVRNVPPHIQAARLLPEAGRRIDYLMTTDGPQPLSMLSAAPDYEHYRERQLQPVADTVLHFLGENFDDIVSGQQGFF
ncbi:DNA polymerase II, partial [Granulosicoccaceae sp. 1_MG-2023]|nr:DNA polymerase II [Granulosicoccaceae sp. 1_MG-2023]